jgi:hypothetical protein
LAKVFLSKYFWSKYFYFGIKITSRWVAEWRSGHLISLRNKKIRARIPPEYKVLGKHSSAMVYKWLNMHGLCVERRNKGIGHKIKFLKKGK